MRRFKKDREILRKGDVLPTLTASFRDSLSFDPSFLERKGLFAWALGDGVHPVRWISAIEAARSLGFASATMLPSDEKLAIKFVGNCISPYQAALMLHYAAKILIQHFQCPIEVDFLQLVQKIDEGCQSFARFRHWFIGDSQFMCDPNMLTAPATQPVPSTSRKRTLLAEEDLTPGPSQHRTQLLPPTVPLTVFNEQMVDPTPISLTDVTGRTFRLPGPLVATRWKQWLAQIRPWLTFDNNAIQLNGVFTQGNFTLEPATEYNIALFKALRCAQDANASGVVDLFDNFTPLPPPAFPVHWRTWASASGLVLDNCWATCGDRCLENSTVLMPPGNFVIKLRMRMRGGAKDVKSRLKQHLAAKGVPEDAVEARVQSIINVVSEEQLASIFKQLDPWASLKNAIGNRVRLIQASVIDSIQHQACGVCLISANQLSTLTSMTTTISTFECGGILVGDDEPASGSFPKTKVSFIAEYKKAGKILLLKGTLVNFGQQMISQKKATQDFKLEPKDAQVITFEISKQYCADWNLVEQNPMRFIWKSFDQIQTKLLSTWPRRFFSRKKSVGPREATTFHCFGRLLLEDVKPIIALSGYSGVFITPKGPDGGPDGSHRVIWLQTTQLEHASAVAKAQPSVLGLVRGKDSLGLGLRRRHTLHFAKQLSLAGEMMKQSAIRSTSPRDTCSLQF